MFVIFTLKQGDFWWWRPSQEIWQRSY